MDRTTITLIIDASGKKTDLDLPNNLPLEEMVGEILKGMDDWMLLHFNSSDFRFLLSDGDEQWRTVQPSMSLNDLEVMDGCYLRLEKVQSFSTDSQNGNRNVV